MDNKKTESKEQKDKIEILKECIDLAPIHNPAGIIGVEACQKVMKDNNLKDEDELQAHFMARIVEFCKGYGKTVVNWNDGMVGENVHEDVIVHYWQGAEVNRNAAVREINRGKKGIISPNSKIDQKMQIS